MESVEIDVDTSSARVVDLTRSLQHFCDGRGDGLVNVFVPHATAGLALMETGSGSEPDLVDTLERLLPRDGRYRHAHGAPGHGADHLLPAIVSPSLVLPVLDGRIAFGTWQSVVLVDLNVDNPRRLVRFSFVPAGTARGPGDNLGGVAGAARDPWERSEGGRVAVMRALQVTRHGPPGEVLEVRTVERPEPGANEVRVRVHAASLNFNDIDRCRGNLVSVPTPPPFTLGMDVCGEVDAAGPGADRWLGKRVVAITKNALGGIADYALADAISVFDAPEGFDDAEGAAFLLPFQTSHLALFRRGRLRAGETLVVHAAASGLGTAGIQLGKAAGARVIAVVGGPEKAAACASLGADLVVDHGAEDFVEAVLGATGDAGADVVYDLAGGDFVERSWRCTAHGGRYLAVGFADDDANGMTGRPLRMACIGNIDIVGVMLAWVDEVDPGMRRFGFNPFGRDVAEEIHADLLRLAVAGEIRPLVGRRVGIEDAGPALDEHEARRSIGRTVVEMVPNRPG